MSPDSTDAKSPSAVRLSWNSRIRVARSGLTVSKGIMQGHVATRGQAARVQPIGRRRPKCGRQEGCPAGQFSAERGTTLSPPRRPDATARNDDVRRATSKEQDRLSYDERMNSRRTSVVVLLLLGLVTAAGAALRLGDWVGGVTHSLWLDEL